MENIPESKHYSFPAEEERIIAFWDDIDAFKEQLRRTEGLPEYVFYDGPPFATGLPHYGHILTGTLKVCRHGAGHAISSHRPPRISSHDTPVRLAAMLLVVLAGTATACQWSMRLTRNSVRSAPPHHHVVVHRLCRCHTDIKSRDDVLKMGIANYNEECRSIVMRYSKEWEKTVTRLGRWIDFVNDYKTLDVKFMESVWWVFRQLFDKGLVYRGFKVGTWCRW